VAKILIPRVDPGSDRKPIPS